MQDEIIDEKDCELFLSCPKMLNKITSEEEEFWLADYLHEVKLLLET